jgi:hypothetical protein
VKLCSFERVPYWSFFTNLIFWGAERTTLIANYFISSTVEPMFVGSLEKFMTYFFHLTCNIFVGNVGIVAPPTVASAMRHSIPHLKLTYTLLMHFCLVTVVHCLTTTFSVLIWHHCDQAGEVTIMVSTECEAAREQFSVLQASAM